MQAIELSGLTKYYGKTRGVDGLTLLVPYGEIYGFIGPNGAGKSTAIRIMTGLISATAGGARVLGLDCAREKIDILKNVGYMPSEANFYPNMRVGDIIKYSARLRGLNCENEAKSLCERLDIDTHKRVRELSLGNRKKLGIVCAAQHRPKLYILDEPTGGLDPLMQKEFFDILEDRRRDGATVFLSSHILAEVQRHCTRAAIIREGRVVAEGGVETLLDASTRRVVLRGVDSAPAIEGIADIKPAHGGVEFLFKGDIKALLAAIWQLPLTDISVTEPDLEEVFLHYYEGGDKNDDIQA